MGLQQQTLWNTTSGVRPDEIAVPKCKQYRYLGLFQENEMIDKDVIRLKLCRSATGVSCDKVEGKFYRITTRPTMLCGNQCWAAEVQHINKMSVVEMRWGCVVIQD